MNRKYFIKTCGLACITAAGLSSLMQSCTASQTINAGIVKDDLIIPLKNFEQRKGNETTYKKYIVVQNELLLFPICIYRVDQDHYEALWMKCSHLGATLQVFGDMLQCPAHGSEFKNNGEVQSGPAIATLRKFPVTIDRDRLKISLKAV